MPRAAKICFGIFAAAALFTFQPTEGARSKRRSKGSQPRAKHLRSRRVLKRSPLIQTRSLGETRARGARFKSWERLLKSHPEYGTLRELTQGKPFWSGRSNKTRASTAPAKVPVFFIHGNSDPLYVKRFRTQRQRLLKRGYDVGDFYGISYGDGELSAKNLAATSLTEETLKRHELAFRSMFHLHFGVPIEEADPSMKFDVVAHSMGVHIAFMVLLGGLDTHVRTFINVGGAPNGIRFFRREKNRNVGILDAASQLFFNFHPLGSLSRAAVDRLLPSMSLKTGLSTSSDATKRIQRESFEALRVVSLLGEEDALVSLRANRYREGSFERLAGASHLDSAEHPRIAEILSAP